MSYTFSFEEWYNIYGEELEIGHAESGADREHGFDSEEELYKEYEIYSDVRIRNAEKTTPKNISPEEG